MSVRYSAVVPAKMHTIEILTELFNQVRKRFRGVSSEDRAKMTVLNLYEHKTLTALSLDFSAAVSTTYEIVNLGTVLLSEHSSVTVLTSEDPKNSVDVPMMVDELVDEGYAIVDGTFIHTQNAYK